MKKLKIRWDLLSNPQTIPKKSLEKERHDQKEIGEEIRSSIDFDIFLALDNKENN